MKQREICRPFAPEKSSGHYPPRNSRAEWKSSFRVIYEYPTMSDARSDKPTADATGRFFSRSAGTGLRSKGRGAAPVLVCVVHPCGRTSRMRTYFLIQKRAHIEDVPFLSCPWKICVAALRLPCSSVISHGTRAHMRIFPFHSCP